MSTKITSDHLVAQLQAAVTRGDGYIMGSRGQNPRTGYLDLSVPESKCKSGWKETGWYFSQYSGKQKTQALFWRKKCSRVWDCNGMMEGIYELATGTCIDSKARYNYAEWCNTKGSGLIPAKYRVPGAAVFWSDSGAGSIHHVAYLEKPVTAGKPEGDWYIIEARGVMYGVVRTKLLSRKPNFWGLMTKYVYYDTPAVIESNTLLGARMLKNGCEGDDVKALQSGLIRLGYDLGRWGADGDFGDATEAAVRAFQRNHSLDVDGIAGPKTIAQLEAALAKLDSQELTEGKALKVQIQGGQCYIRTEPNTSGTILSVAHEGATYEYAGETSDNGWLKVYWIEGSEGWVSGKYGVLVSC